MSMELTTITTTRELTNTQLSAIRDNLSAEYEAARKKVTEYGTKADTVVQKYNRSIACALDSIPVNDKGKLDPEKYDGFKSVGEFAQEGLGLKHATAFMLIAVGKVYNHPEKYPAEWSKMSASNLYELLRADRQKAIAATEKGDISAESSQTALREFAKQNPSKGSKSGKASVVTLHRVYLGGQMTEVTDIRYGGPLTMDDFLSREKADARSIHLSKVDEYKMNPNDAPKTSLTCKRYVNVLDDLTAEVLTLIPVYVPADNRTKEQRAEDELIEKYLAKFPGKTREDAVAALQALGII